MIIILPGLQQVTLPSLRHPVSRLSQQPLHGFSDTSLSFSVTTLALTPLPITEAIPLDLVFGSIKVGCINLNLTTFIMPIRVGSIPTVSKWMPNGKPPKLLASWPWCLVDSWWSWTYWRFATPCLPMHGHALPFSVSDVTCRLLLCSLMSRCISFSNLSSSTTLHFSDLVTCLSQGLTFLFLQSNACINNPILTSEGGGSSRGSVVGHLQSIVGRQVQHCFNHHVVCCSMSHVLCGKESCCASFRGSRRKGEG